MSVSVHGQEILAGLNLRVAESEVVALLGPNGSGKSTLAKVLVGDSQYKVTAGSISFNKNNLLKLKVEDRAQLGLFTAWQYPPEIPGLTLSNFLRLAYNATHERNLSVEEFLPLLTKKMSEVGLPEKLLDRGVNEAFSGGEKKRAEMVQLLVLKPKLAILDETDSGLDVDALKLVAESLRNLKKLKPTTSILIITHHRRILDYLKPDQVAIIKQGKIIKTGQADLVGQIESQGFSQL